MIAAGILVNQTSIVVLEALLVAIGLSMGLTFPVTTVSVQNGVDQMHLGVATGVMTFLRSLGSALGVAVLGTIALSYGIPLGGEAGAGVQHITEAHPFSILYFTMGGMMLLAAALYLLMPHKPLRGRAAPASAE
jgi:hypothetical protein